MNNIVILDIETTGDNYLIDEICQMSYIVLDSKLNIVKAKNFFFMVDYVYFKSNKKKLNIHELKRLSDNKTFKDGYEEIFNDLNNNFIVCHKCDHDISFIKSEFMRIDHENKFVYEEFCTMKHYTDILKIPSENFGYKYPKLIEIMPYLNIKRGDIYSKSKDIFNLDDEEMNFHDSRVDVVATYLVTIKTEEILIKYKESLNNQENINMNTNINKYKDLEDKLSENIKSTIKDEQYEYKKSISKKRYNNKIGWLRRILIIVMCFVIAKIVIVAQKEDKIIDIVSNYEEQEGYTAQELIDNTIEDETVYGWDIQKVDSDTYFVSYEFDDDDDYENGTSLFCYQYYEPTNEVSVIEGELNQKYVDLGYIEPDSNRLINGLQVINTTYHSLQEGEVRGESYIVDKELAEKNLTKNKELDPTDYDDEKEEIYHEELILTGGKRATVYIVDDSNRYHINTDCEALENAETVYKVFLDNARAENRTLCELERKSAEKK